MAEITLKNSSISDTTQGWYSSSSTSGSGLTITMNFNTTEMETFSKLAKNITITSAKLHVNCAKSGADRKKLFRLKLYAGSTLCYDHGTELYSSQYAYDDSDVPITLNTAGVKKWLTTSSKTKKITSVDPQTKKYFSLSSGYCSYNYVRITDAWLVINYTINHSSATFESTTMDIGDTYDITINSGNDKYTHDIILSIGTNKYPLKEKVKGGTTNITIPLEIGSNNLSSSTTTSGTITIQTYDENGSAISGDPYSYDVIITADSGHKPTAPSSATITTNHKKSEVYYALSNFSEITVQPSGANGQNGASIKEYLLTLNGVQKKCSPGNTVTFKAPLVETNYQKYSLSIKAIDSRGYSSKAYSPSIYVSAYTYPSADIKTLCRWNIKAEQQDDVDGTAVKVNYAPSYTRILYSIEDPAITYSNSFSLTYYINGTKGSKITNGAVIQRDGGFSTETNYTFKFLSADVFQTNNLNLVPEYQLGSAMYLLHFRHRQNSVGIGCAGEALENGEKGKITMGWPVKFKERLILDKALDVNQGGTGVSNQTELKKFIGKLMYPVGSIYFSVTAENPSNIFGGTWVEWGAGRVPIGVDTSNEKFNAAEKEEGEYTHKQTNILGVTLASRSSKNLYNHNLDIKEQWPNLETLYSTAQYSGDYDSYSKNTSTEINVGEKVIIPELETSTLQPYVTCYMWKRTA